MNYVYVIANYRNKLQGTERHYSTAPIIAQILLVLADRASSIASARLLPWSWLFGLALADISLWILVFAGFGFLFRRP